MPAATPRCKTWVVYPERKEKAGVVIVIHEIFGLTDWVRGVADQLAADGFIAAPDLLSGKGPGGGGTESFEGDEVRRTIRGSRTRRPSASTPCAIMRLAHRPRTGSPRTIGFCWGGGHELQLRDPPAQAQRRRRLLRHRRRRRRMQMAKIVAPVLGPVRPGRRPRQRDDRAGQEDHGRAEEAVHATSPTARGWCACVARGRQKLTRKPPTAAAGQVAFFKKNLE